MAVVGEGHRRHRIVERLRVVGSTAAEGLVAGVRNPDIAAKVPERLEDVISQALALLEGRGSVHRIEDEQAGVGGPTVLEKVRTVAEVSDYRSPVATDDADDATHPSSFEADTIKQN